VFNTKEENI